MNLAVEEIEEMELPTVAQSSTAEFSQETSSHPPSSTSFSRTNPSPAKLSKTVTAWLQQHASVNRSKAQTRVLVESSTSPVARRTRSSLKRSRVDSDSELFSDSESSDRTLDGLKRAVRKCKS